MRTELGRVSVLRLLHLQVPQELFSLGIWWVCYIASLLCFCFSFFLDLRKFRTYKGSSVRDLLRAMRNKVRAEGARRGRQGRCTARSSYPFPVGAPASLK